ncbi:histidine kinase [Gillisia sp. M10.2A]|uniref:Histidine kinase n=1 Tax=Gillisia lutea TaxID=2909668 RepID=A0ABS9EF23_9FLAO|nr:histidine kinase [Gillisia lutea]MCF4100380.1 histidine kinase [Gillisia lutea]
MNFTLNSNIWLLIKIIVFLTIVIPLGITTYQIVFLGKESIVFLEGYPSALGFTIIVYYLLLLILGFIWLVVQLKSIVSLKNEKKRNELLHLQSQVNPHFFFNMLNNLYGMVGKDAETAKSLILKLSGLMRYSIYEGEKNQVTLSEEISYLENFIELNKIRYHKQIDIQFDVYVENENEKVLPLMFIILLENAFKHGVENLTENAFIHIKLSSYEKILNFEISNNFDINELPEKNGIGIKNLKRRLELVYSNKHALELSQEDSVFKAFLQLKK